MGQTVFPRSDYSSKADKVTGATSGNFAALDSNGNLTDSGHKHSDYATKVSSPTTGDLASLDGNGNIADSGIKIVYSESTAPSNPTTGTIWLKKKV